MENVNTLGKFLEDRMSLDALGINEPDISLVASAREKIRERNKPVIEREDIFSKLALVFNLRVKLYQAGLSTILIAGGFFYFSHIGNDAGTNDGLSQNFIFESSVKSSTLLTSIQTCIVRD